MTGRSVIAGLSAAAILVLGGCRAGAEAPQAADAAVVFPLERTDGRSLPLQDGEPLAPVLEDVYGRSILRDVYSGEDGTLPR